MYQHLSYAGSFLCPARMLRMQDSQTYTRAKAYLSTAASDTTNGERALVTHQLDHNEVHCMDRLQHLFHSRTTSVSVYHQDEVFPKTQLAEGRHYHTACYGTYGRWQKSKLDIKEEAECLRQSTEFRRLITMIQSHWKAKRYPRCE